MELRGEECNTVKYPPLRDSASDSIVLFCDHNDPCVTHERTVTVHEYQVLIIIMIITDCIYYDPYIISC